MADEIGEFAADPAQLGELETPSGEAALDLQSLGDLGAGIEEPAAGLAPLGDLGPGMEEPAEGLAPLGDLGANMGEAEPIANPMMAGTPEAAPAPIVPGDNVIGIQKIRNIKVRVQAMLGGISLSVSELANLKQGELLSLDTQVGDAIDIVANGHLVARGEIVVVEGLKPRFGITLKEIIEAPDMAG